MRPPARKSAKDSTASGRRAAAPTGSRGGPAGLHIRPATRQEVARFFRTVVRTRMSSESELLSADRLDTADESLSEK